jgi:hypothetical protein
MGSVVSSYKDAAINIIVLIGISIGLIVIGSYSASAANTIKSSWRKQDDDLQQAYDDFNVGAYVGLGLGIGLLVIIVLLAIALFIFEVEPIAPILGNMFVLLIVGISIIGLSFYAGVEEALGVSAVKRSDTYNNTTDQGQKDALNKAISDGRIAAGVYLAISGLAIVVFVIIILYEIYQGHKKHEKEKKRKKQKDERKHEMEERKSAQKHHEQQIHELEEEEFQAKIAEEKARVSAAKKQLETTAGHK